MRNRKFGFAICLYWISLGIFPAFGKDNRYVEVLLSSDNTIYEQGLFSLQSLIDTEIKVSYLDIISSESGDLAGYFRELESSKVSLVIAVGTAAAKAAKENLKSTPLIFSMVNFPKSLGLNSSNSCGVSMDVPVGEFFQTLKDLSPTSKNVYAFYSTHEGEYAATEGDYSDIKHKLNYQKMKLSGQSDLAVTLEGLKGKLDAIYMVNDPLYNKTKFDILSNFCKKNGIVLMTSYPTLVKVGATFSVSPDYGKIGVLTAQMANRILAKESTCETERIILPDLFSFFLNESYAKESNLKIPDSLIERSKLSRLFHAGVNLFHEGKYKSATMAFQKILRKDPKNHSASAYLQIILEKQSGSKIKELMDTADKNYLDGKYLVAREYYQKVLSLNPQNLTAIDKSFACLHMQSEKDRLSGNTLMKSGKTIDAIRMYLTSLRTLPSNSKASSDLSSARISMYSKVGGLLKEGIISYNERNYSKSNKIFEDILLIDPSNKEATEYLRLSMKKGEALKGLRRR